MGVTIVYHSGVGGTRTICELLKELLEQDGTATNIYSVGDFGLQQAVEDCAVLVLAFPTYHCRPSASMHKCIDKLPRLDMPIKAFMLTTCGLYSGNALRIFAKACREKNIYCHGSEVFRTPATDGTLLLPALPFMYSFGKDTAQKLIKSARSIHGILKGSSQLLLPPYRWYTILNYPNQALGQRVKHYFKLDQAACTDCGNCIRTCLSNCWQRVEGFPKWQSESCEYCFGCVHNCPTEAIHLSARTSHKKKLTKNFYQRQAEGLRSEIRCLRGE